MSFYFHHEGQRTAHLTAAILIYGEDKAGHSSATPCYATIHPVDVSDTRPVIRAGTPATRAALLAFADALAGASRLRHGLLPPDVLSVGPDHLVWWVPPGVRTAHFDTKGAIGKRSGRAPHPGLVFAVRNRQWFVVAVKGGERPAADTATFNAPYMNVWAASEICAGNVPLPAADSLTGRMAAWNDAFFNSYFTHPNHDRAIRYRGGLECFWRDMLDAVPPAFPEKVLVRRDKETVGQFITDIEGGRQ